MKRIFIIISLLALGLAPVVQAQAPIGSISKDISYSLFDADQRLQAQQLSTDTGKLVVLFFFTPW